MTAPTPAQIEAAAQAIFMQRFGRDWRQWDCGADAAAALTAAAQVGEPYKDGDSLVTELVWEVDRAVKQAMREDGRYDTVIRHILNKRLTAAAQVEDDYPRNEIDEGTRMVKPTLSAVAQVGEPEYEYIDGHPVAIVTGPEKLDDATIERCAQYHDNAARECDAIAEVNMDNDLGPDCVTRAIDHRVDAAAIRELKHQ